MLRCKRVTTPVEVITEAEATAAPTRTLVTHLNLRKHALVHANNGGCMRQKGITNDCIPACVYVCARVCEC